MRCALRSTEAQRLPYARQGEELVVGEHMGRDRGCALEWPKVGGRGRWAIGGPKEAISGIGVKRNWRHYSGEEDCKQGLVIRAGE